jgi:hypothetical protein
MIRLRSAVHVRLLSSVVAAALLPAASAHASMLDLGAGRCYVKGEPVTVTGTGFTAGATVSLGAGVGGSGVADATGRVVIQTTAPPVRGVGPRTVSVDATDGANPANTAPAVTFKVVSELLGANYAQAIGGRPRQRTTWRFAGFAEGLPIYGHFRFRGRTRRNFRFGLARGVCGALTVRARRVPVRVVRPGLWTLHVDQARRYSPRTEDQRHLRFRISRTFRRSAG